MLVPSTESWHRILALDPGARLDSSTDPTAILDPRVGSLGITVSQGRIPVHCWVSRWDRSTILDPRLASQYTTGFCAGCQGKTGSQCGVPVQNWMPGYGPSALLEPRVRIPVHYWVTAQCLEDSPCAACTLGGSPGHPLRPGQVSLALCLALSLTVPSIPQPEGGSACSRARLRRPTGW